MERPDHSNLPVGTPVHVEFDGEVYHVSEHASKLVQPSPNHIAVSDGAHIHHVHRNSLNVTVVPAPKPNFKLGQVWRSGDVSFVVYDHLDLSSGEKFYLCGPRPAQYAQCTWSSDEFFTAFPNAVLVLNPDGSFSDHELVF